MRVLVWVASAAILMTLLVPNGAAEETCETTVVVERCSYDRETEHERDDCSGNDAFGSCERYMENVSGERIRVGDTWVFVGERETDYAFDHWSDGFSSDCQEETRFTDSARYRYVAAGSNGLTVAVVETERDNGHRGHASCPDGNTTQEDERSETSRRVAVRYGQAHLTVDVTEWEERSSRKTADETTETEGCGTTVMVDVYAFRGAKEEHETGHCRDL